MDRLAQIAQRLGLTLIEDAAQAHGAELRGRRVDSMGRAACFSFYSGKNLGCYGDGGAVVTDDADLAAKVRKLRNHGRSSKYVHDELGFGHRLDALQAAILAAKLPHLDAANQARRRLAQRYGELLSDTDLALPVEPGGVHSVYHLYVVRSPRRDELVETLRSQGIEAGVHYPLPLHLQPAYAFLGHQPGSFPVAEAAAEQQDRVVQAIKQAIA